VFKAASHNNLTLRLSLFWTFWGIFGIGFMLTFPVNPQILPDVQRFLQPIISPFLNAMGRLFYNGQAINTNISSDSKSMYLLALLLLILSTISTIFLHAFKFRLSKKAYHWIRVIIRYYIAYQLLHYGFNKLFKWQFFMPEPNIAYSRIGDVSKGLLFWSVVGSSYWFTVIVGGLEIVAGLLLLFRRTLNLGIMTAFVIFTFIVLINFSFDISVKLFSTILLFFTVSLIRPDWQLIRAWFFETLSPVTIHRKDDSEFYNGKFSTYAVTKTFVVLALIIDSLWIYGKTGNWNDDNQSRPVLHGAYSVIVNDVNDWKSVYVNRKGYLIAEPNTGLKRDYKLYYDKQNKHILLKRHDDSLSFKYSATEKHLLLTGIEAKHPIVLKRMAYDSLPLFNDSFDWWMD
jgi:uncharacterized membrane protein YphA (DoxX/SURF4 family)